MDAKTAIEFLRHDKMGNGNIRIITTESTCAIADFIEQQEKYAELGRLAIVVISMHDNNVFQVIPCNFANTILGRDKDFCNKCAWYNFCQKRAELLDKTEVSE